MPRVREIKPKDPTELEDSPLKYYKKTDDGLKRKRKDFYKDGCDWLKRRRTKILNKQTEIIELNFEEQENLFTPRINRRSKSVVKLSFSQRQKQYQRRRSQNRQSLYDKELNQFSYSPRINLKSSRIAKRSLNRVPLSERNMGKSKSNAMAMLTGIDSFIQFHDDLSNG